LQDQGRTARKVKAGWYSLAIGSTGFSTGKHYWEIKVNGQEFSVGVVLKSLPSTQLDNYLAASTDAWAYEAVAQRKRCAALSGVVCRVR
jgi:murein DD-endopeptidase MepM/ murein hydrolase activator NlpD